MLTRLGTRSRPTSALQMHRKVHRYQNMTQASPTTANTIAIPTKPGGTDLGSGAALMTFFVGGSLSP